MALQVCDYPGCRAITLMVLCEDHRELADEEHTEDAEFTPPQKIDRSQDLVDLVMKTAREQSATHPTKEPVMSGPPLDSRRCREILKKGTRCVTGCKKGEDVCQYHFEKGVGLIRKNPVGGGTAQTAVSTVVSTPVHRKPRAPITLADPIVVNGSPAIERHVTSVVEGLAAEIERRRTEIVTLEGAMELLQRHG